MKTTLTESYVLVETDDIDFSTLRLAVEQFKLANSKQPVKDLEEIERDQRLSN